MSKRVVKKVRKLRNSQEYSNQHRVGHQTVETPSLDADQHVFSFTPNQTDRVSTQHKSPKEPYNFEEIQTGKKHRQKGGIVKVRVPPPISQTIDAPTIIHNILNTPAQKMHHSQVSLMQNMPQYSSSGKDTATVNHGLPYAIQAETMDTQEFALESSIETAQESAAYAHPFLRTWDSEQLSGGDSQMKARLLKLLEGNIRLAQQFSPKGTTKKVAAANQATSGANMAGIGSDVLANMGHPHGVHRPLAAQSQSPRSKRHGSGPKARHAREQSSCQSRSKKRGGSGSQYAIMRSLNQQNRPPILSTSVQTRGSRGRSKDASVQILSQNTPSLKHKGTSHQSSKLTSSMPNMQVLRQGITEQANKDQNGTKQSSASVKSLAAIAIGLRSNQCQSALLQHKKLKQQQYTTALPPNIMRTPTSKRGSKETLRFNKTTSIRHWVKQEQAERDLAQKTGRSKRSQSKEVQSLQQQSKGGSRKTELECYLSKILTQQQQLYVNKQEQAQVHALYNQTGTESASRSKHATRSSKKFVLQQAASANVTQSWAKPKKLNGVVLLSGNLEKQVQFQQSQRSQMRNSQPGSVNQSKQRDSQSSGGKKKKQQQHNQRSMASLQYMVSSGRQRGIKSQSSANMQAMLTAGGGSTNAVAQSNSLMLMKQQQQQILNNGRGKSKGQLKALTSHVKGNSGTRDIRNQNYLLTSEIQKAIKQRRKALDQIELAKSVDHFPKSIHLSKANSERQLVAKSPREDLIGSSSHNTIVNIRANAGQELDSCTSNADDHMNTELDTMSKAKSRSTNVEYHSMRPASDLASHKLKQIKIESRQTLMEVKITHDQQTQISNIQHSEIGVQTSLLLETSMKRKESEQESSVSHREDKIQSMRETIDPNAAAFGETELKELAVWAQERQAIETYGLFYANQFEPFVRDFLKTLAQEPQRLSSANQLLDIFGVRHEQLITQEERQTCASADLFYKLTSHQILAMQKLSKFALGRLEAQDKESRMIAIEKDEQIDSLKGQVRKLQKELFIRSEKLHLSDQMNKLKDKEVTQLRNKSNALTEAAERSNREHQRAIHRKDQEQERNFAKAARELKTLYEQNKELFQHNKALRDDLQEQDEKVRKLVNVIQRHPSLMQDIEDELDKTETKLHDQSQISNALPGTNKRGEQVAQKGKQEPQHGVVFVGQNKIAIPKFDPVIIDKFTKLNIEGKLPHIVETTKFDPAAVKQQVKEMFRDIKLQQYGYEDDDIGEDHHQAMYDPHHSSSGIGNDTPFSPVKKILSESASEHHHHQQLYQESSNDMSGGERKRIQSNNKYLSANSPNVLIENQLLPSTVSDQDCSNEPHHGLQPAQSHAFLPNTFQLKDQYSQQQQKIDQRHLGMQTPVQKVRKTSNGISAGPKKDLNSQYAIAHSKQHQVQTIVTLQNQLYHQLMTQTQNMPPLSSDNGTFSTPNNHQTPILPAQESSKKPSLLSPSCQPNQNQNFQSKFSEERLEGIIPEFQSVDLPMLQTPSQTATLALELTEGLNHQIMQHSSDIGAGTAVFNQILINDPAQVGSALLQRGSLHQQMYSRTGQPSAIEADYSDHHQHLNIRSSGMAGLIHHLHHNRVMYEEEEKSGAYSGTDYSNKQENLLLMTGVGEPVDDTETRQITHKNTIQSGPTLQDQISKQYSPILRRHESLEHIGDFSPSLINDRNELSNGADGRKYSLMRIQATASLGMPQQRQANYSLGERNGFCGLTSIDQEKSVGLLDSIAVKEEDSTQKKYIEPQASTSLVDHGGNEQSANTNQFILEQQPQQYAQYERVNCDFDGGEAPLDISRVDDNFDSSENQGNDHASGQDSADFLEDQNFGQVVADAGRRSSYDGHYHMSAEHIL